jgi:hypothetical protein
MWNSWHIKLRRKAALHGTQPLRNGRVICPANCKGYVQCDKCLMSSYLSCGIEANHQQLLKVCFTGCSYGNHCSDFLVSLCYKQVDPPLQNVNV